MDCREAKVRSGKLVKGNCSNSGDNKRGGGKLHLRCVMKVKPTGFLNGLGEGCKRKREIKNG